MKNDTEISIHLSDHTFPKNVSAEVLKLFKKKNTYE